MGHFPQPHPFLAPHDILAGAHDDLTTVLAQGDATPLITIKPYGKGYFIYCSSFQPLIGHSGFAPGMYAYVIFRRAIEWAFESAQLPLPKLQPVAISMLRCCLDDSPRHGEFYE